MPRLLAADDGRQVRYAAFFEDDGEAGCLYVSDRRSDTVRHLQIYTRYFKMQVAEDDVRIVWSRDGTKCGVIMWGGMRGIIDLENNTECCSFIAHRNSLPIRDPVWLSGFEDELRAASEPHSENGA